MEDDTIKLKRETRRADMLARRNSILREQIQWLHEEIAALEEELYGYYMQHLNTPEGSDE